MGPSEPITPFCEETAPYKCFKIETLEDHGKSARRSQVGEYLVEATVHQVRYLFGLNSTDDDLKNEEINLKLAEDRVKQEVEREKRNTKETEKDIGEYLVEATVHQVRYLFCLNSIVDDLQNEEINLKLAEDRIKQEVEREKRNTKVTEKDVEKWLVDVDNVVEEVERLKEEIQVNKRSTRPNGWCPNWVWRYRLSRKAAKKTLVMAKLQVFGKFNRVAHLKPLQGIKLSAPRDFMSFEATKLTSYQIIEALKDEKTMMVGMYGTGGAGKTTLANMIGNEVQEQKIFDEVVKAVVSQNPNLINIQDQLAGSLGMTIQEKSSLEERAKRLHLRFTDTTKKILIILDDVWAKLDLATIGIPFGSDRKGCKILLTTRRQHVCTAMGCQSRISLNTLNEEEGLALLKRHAGIGDGDFSMNDVAKEVARECKGLPLAIVSVGSALKEKGISEWKAVSQKLKHSKLVDVEDVDVDVYACLKLSYDYLKGENTKLVFLLCSLFPEDFKIEVEDLVRYGIGLGLFEDADTIEDARNELQLLVNNLKDCCLLLDAGEQCVKMHDMVRDVALWIASTGSNVFMGKAGNGLTEWPKKDGLDHYTAISLMKNNLKELPTGLVCPKLEILLLGSESYDHFIVVPEQFFKEMKALKVLKITNGELSLESLEFSENIRSLQLINCRLRDMSSLGKLKRLRILSLQDSSFGEISEELRNLGELRVLDLRGTFISLTMVEKFPPLEEFSGDIELKIEQKSTEINSEPCFRADSLDEDAECHPQAFFFSKLRRHQIKVNHDYPKNLSRSTALRVSDIEASSLIVFKPLYRNLQFFALVNVMDCQNIVPSIDQGGFNELDCLLLCDCKDLECIIDASQQLVPHTAFSNLTQLYLTGMNTLSEIYCGANYPRQLLENLEILYVRRCQSICRLSSATLLQQQKLKKVEIWSCNKLQQVFQSYDDRQSDLVLLLCLAKLKLYDLWELKWIWRQTTHRVSLQNLMDVEVTECHSLRYIFSVSLAKSLVQLQTLKIRECQSLEHIVFDDIDVEGNVSAGDKNVMALPMLRKLELEELPKLINFCPEKFYSTWPALKHLTLESCPNFAIGAELEANLDNFVENLEFLYVVDCNQLSDAVLAVLKHGLKNLEHLKIGNLLGVQLFFQLGATLSDGQESKISLLRSSLKDLTLENLPELEVLCKGPTHVLSLQNLTSLILKDCNRLRHIFSSALARNLLQLKHFRIEHCKELEQIIVEDEDEAHNQISSSDHLQHVYFPNLIYIKVKECNKLERLFHVDIARGLQKLRELTVCDNMRLVEVFGQKDEAGIGNDYEIVLSELWHLELNGLPSLTNVCPMGYHFIFPSLRSFKVIDCPMISTRFSAGQTDSVHAEAEEPQMDDENVSAKVPLECASLVVDCVSFDKIQEVLPPYRED
ncbi:putative disease resistance protein [Citrus sinensis]|uniref:Disease resistance protein n=1 Tax=Citrus sinensis TaxID=2711 RepID=A0ACB8NWZ0_CITSI|nr:putative disease resistance protein [Citrus sinensis]